MLLENGTDKLFPHKVTTYLQLVKKKHSICEAQQKEVCLYLVLEAPVDWGSLLCFLILTGPEMHCSAHKTEEGQGDD